MELQARLLLSSPADMHDPRLDQLARVLVRHSTKLQKGENVLIELFDAPDEMGVALIRATRDAGAVPFLQIHRARISRELTLQADESQLGTISSVELARMKKMQAYIAVRGSHNITELSDVPEEKMRLVAGKMRPVMDWRINKTKWVVLRWPTPAMAQQAQMSTAAFEDYFFRVCTLDYARLNPGMEALKALMDKSDRVQIKGPGTDLLFSIKGIGSVICGGDRNIPDGEVFSCPVKNSVEGHVSFNAPTIYQGTAFDNIRLDFESGRIVKATANNTGKLNEILDSDDGARYIGEFSIAFNPHILHPIRDILFDEKIAGSFHFTPGQAYEIAGNGNKSRIHWDMVNIQRSDYGGGEIWLDGKLIRKDGEFVLPALKKLNRDYLLK
ncbi:MAG TPA: aminopeptidase, partial [Terrimicrobiaceae bacterium]|nr:aminopeptidase [Terrimicrobiaceae bacterium]